MVHYVWNEYLIIVKCEKTNSWQAWVPLIVKLTGGFIMKHFWCISIGIVIAGLTLACNGSDSQVGGVCNQGDQQACPCLNRLEGVQVCREDRSGWQPCQCPGNGDEDQEQENSSSLLFDFNDGEPSDWLSAITNSWAQSSIDWSIHDGFLEVWGGISNGGGAGVALYRQDGEYDNLSISADVKLVEGPYASGSSPIETTACMDAIGNERSLGRFGLIVRFNPEEGQGYALLGNRLVGNGTCLWLGRIDEYGSGPNYAIRTFFTVLDAATLGETNPEQAHRFNLVADGDTITGNIDGVVAVTANDSTYTSGHYVLHNYDGKTQFDNIEIIDCELGGCSGGNNDFPYPLNSPSWLQEFYDGFESDSAGDYPGNWTAAYEASSEPESNNVVDSPTFAGTTKALQVSGSPSGCWAATFKNTSYETPSSGILRLSYALRGSGQIEFSTSCHHNEVEAGFWTPTGCWSDDGCQAGAIQLKWEETQGDSIGSIWGCGSSLISNAAYEQWYKADIVFDLEQRNLWCFINGELFGQSEINEERMPPWQVWAGSGSGHGWIDEITVYQWSE